MSSESKSIVALALVLPLSRCEYRPIAPADVLASNTPSVLSMFHVVGSALPSCHTFIRLKPEPRCALIQYQVPATWVSPLTVVLVPSVSELAERPTTSAVMVWSVLNFNSNRLLFDPSV